MIRDGCGSDMAVARTLSDVAVPVGQAEPDLLREAGDCEHVRAGTVEMGGDRGELLAHCVEDPIELRRHRLDEIGHHEIT